MKKKNILFVLLITILAGCVQENAVTATSIPTRISPSSTPTLIQPTPTIYLSPLPTLSALETYDKLYNSEYECNRPCWWGIIPSVSKWDETKQFIDQFSIYVYGVSETNYKITKSEISDTYIWYVAIPNSNSDTTTAVFFEVQNNVVSAIEARSELFNYFYPINKLFEEYGQPDKILINIGEYSSSETENYAGIYILYDSKYFLIEYSFSGLKTMNPLTMCLDEYPSGSMFLWSPNTELDFDFSTLKHLGDYSELNAETFYEKFKDENNKCLEISKETWE